MKFFNLTDYAISISNLFLRMQVLSSMAWRIDTLIVAQCRSLFKQLKLTPLAATLDGEADLRAAIAEGSWTEAMFAECGPDRATAVRTLHILSAMRIPAHDLAQQATLLVPWSNGTQRLYRLPELEDLFYPNGSSEPSGESLMRMQMSVDRAAKRTSAGDDAKKKAKRLMEMRLNEARAKIAGMNHRTTTVAETLLQLYHYSMDCDQGVIEGTFDELHTDVQRVLIENAVGSAERAVRTAEDNPKEVSNDEYCDLLDQSEIVIADLKKILDSPKFNGGIVAVRVPKEGSTTQPKVLAPAAMKTKHVSTLDKRKTEAQAKKPRTPRKPKTTSVVAKAQPAITPATPAPTSVNSLSSLKELLSTSNDV
jgi:hypothetical protein